MTVTNRVSGRTAGFPSCPPAGRRAGEQGVCKRFGSAGRHEIGDPRAAFGA
jgi:hypothetical protein